MLGDLYLLLFDFGIYYKIFMFRDVLRVNRNNVFENFFKI